MRRPLPALLALLASLTLASAAHAEDQEWVLKLKKEAQNISISIGGNSLYGSGKERIRGSGKVVELARSVGAFSRVRVDGPIDVRIAMSTVDAAVRVRADDNVEPLITTRVDGDTLVVGLKEGAAFMVKEPVRVLVDARQLQSLQLRGSGDADLETLKTDRFSVDLSGSGDLHIGLLEAKDFQARLSGSGDLRMAGRADQQDWDLSGSGDASASSLTGSKVRARLSGSGDLALGVCQELDAQLSGSGDLRYAGRPSVKSQVSGSGELLRR